MNEATWERWGAVSGLVGVALGVAGATFERGAPGVGASLSRSRRSSATTAPSCSRRAC